MRVTITKIKFTVNFIFDRAIRYE